MIDLSNRPFAASSYIVFPEGKFLYMNDDYAVQAYKTQEISFVAQPIGDEQMNRNSNVIPVPLMMTDEWEIIRDDLNIVDRLRKIPKTHDFCFIGQTHYVGREVFKEIEKDGTLAGYSYLFRENNKGIYDLSPRQKRQELIKFLEEIAACNFVFCPRGIGSSSFRLYQSLMVGSVPIITGMNDYPFKNKIDWDEISFRGDLDSLRELISYAKDTPDYRDMREKGMWFWDIYCRHDNLYEELRTIIKERTISYE